MTAALGTVRLCADGRMLAAGGSGVAAYTHVLHEAQRRLVADSLILVDRSGAMRLPASAGRARRWLRAMLPIGARAGPDGRGRLAGDDLFRLAQAWFDVQRRLLPVRLPGPPGVMHWTYPVPLRLVGWANLYTVHDAIPLRTPELSPIDPRRHGRLLRAIAAEAARTGALVTVSDAARAEIVEALGCDPGLVVNGGAAVPAPAPAGGSPAGLADGGYLLVCGSVEARKNIGRIVAAYRRSGVGLPLVIAGRDGWGADATRSAVAGTPGVMRLAEVDDPTMAALLRHARALLMPSLAEGFGLPLIEAMARGTPVLTSAQGALAETAGGAALLVDPRDVSEIAAGIARLCADGSLRERLAARGRINAARFTVAAFADRLAPVYAAAIARPTGLAYPDARTQPG